MTTTACDHAVQHHLPARTVSKVARGPGRDNGFTNIHELGREGRGGQVPAAPRRRAPGRALKEG
jgi:hypothetical protein